MKETALAVHAARVCELQPMQTVGIVGGGPLGLAVAAVAHARGAVDVAVLADDIAERAGVEGAGVTTFPFPTTEVMLEQVRTALWPFGPDLVFECRGDSAARLVALQLARPAGTIVLVANDGRPTNLNPNLIVFHDKRVLVSTRYLADDARAARALAAAGRLRLPLAPSQMQR